jgi:hypothetical protein
MKNIKWYKWYKYKKIYKYFIIIHNIYLHYKNIFIVRTNYRLWKINYNL